MDDGVFNYFFFEKDCAHEVIKDNLIKKCFSYIVKTCNTSSEQSHSILLFEIIFRDLKHSELGSVSDSEMP